jgi:hypothetical protein
LSEVTECPPEIFNDSFMKNSVQHTRIKVR